MTTKKLTFRQKILVAGTLFGMFFGAGNLIFPVHLGQMAGRNAVVAMIGFIITAVGIPVFGVAAIGITHSDGLQTLAGKVSKGYGIFFTCLLYLTIGPLFAIPRCATVSFTTGVAPMLGDSGAEWLYLLIFSAVFFAFVLFFSLRPGKITVWIGKIINPIFLIFFAVLMIAALLAPGAAASAVEPVAAYQSDAFFPSLIEGYGTMDAIAVRTEGEIDYTKRMKRLAGSSRLSIAAATAHAACTTAADIGADAVITVSQRGTTARLVSRFHPGTPIIACLLDQQVRRQMALYWGVEPIMMPYASSTDELVDFAVQAAAQAGVVHEGDLVVVTAGVPVGVAGTTNMIRIQQVGGALVNAVGIGEKKASGPLCICRSTDEVAEKFQPGDVLVVPYTTNELLPYIRQAAAVITEEASVECHTATIGLALDKPVIVGAAGAVQRLTDGTMVTVDCARGLVRAMP